MTTQNQTATTGAPGTEGTVPASAPEPTVEPTAKVEIKEGKVLVDGKKFVAEQHLIAAKEGLEKQLKQAQTAHEQAIDKVRLEASESQKQIAELNAKITENEQARQAGAVTDEEAAKVKQELEAAKGSVELLKADADKALEYRRALLVMKYGVTEDTIKDKDMKSLDLFEEALKAVSTARGGVGPYALGGGSEGAVPQTDMERAAKVLASTPVRGVRTAETS